MIVLTLAIIVSFPAVSCMKPIIPVTTNPPSLNELEEKSLPPVFSNIDLLRGRYSTTFHFPNSYSRQVFGTLPIQLEAEFAEMTLNTSLITTPERLVAYRVIRPVVDEAYAYKLAQRLGFEGELEENKQLRYPDYRFHNGPSAV